MENHDAVKASIEIKKTTQITRRYTPVSGALDQVSGKILSRVAEMDRPA